MKRIRFYRTGGKKEVLFLEKMLSENYLLETKTGCFYTFTKNKETSKELIIEFIDKKSFKLDSKLREDFENQTTLNKKIWLAPFYVSYSYLESESFKYYSNELSDESELNFLKYRVNQLSNFHISLIILGIILWLLIEIFFKSQLKSMIPLIMFTLVGIGLLSFIPGHIISKQIETLESKLGKFSNLFIPTLTIVFKDMSDAPDISQLNFLGHWIFVTEKKKKKEYYYKLSSNLSREDIKIEINSALNIEQNNISISSSDDLFTIGF